MQGINGFSPINLNTTIERPLQQDSSTDARFLQSIIEVAVGQKASQPVVYAGSEGSRPDFFTNPEKVASNPNLKQEKNIDEILGEIEKILSQIKEESKERKF